MKLPSLNYLVIQAKESFLRFPLTLLASLVAVLIGIVLIEYGDDIENKLPYINVMLCMALGIPLYFCTAIISEKFNFEKRTKVVFMLAASLILMLVFFTLPNIDSTHNTSLPYIKYAIYNITIHLFVSFVPFINSPKLNGFWQYNKTLFLRVFTSFIFSAVLYIGLVLALLASQELFEIKIHDEIYAELFIVIAGLFNTWLFVAGIPKNLDALEELQDYPKGLKFFAQYILLPLLTVYLIILYLYGGKIMIGWNWPKGIVSYLIILIAVVGILTFLLLHPYGKQEENSWIKKLSRGYYYALFPLLILLYIAIFMRIDDYGITIKRYIVILLAVWLTIVCIYTALGKNNIKFIPASLALMLLFMSFGPWGMFSVSERQQVNRLKNLLEKNAILRNDKIVDEVVWNQDTLNNLSSDRENWNEGKLNDSLHNEILSILNYLDDHHGFTQIEGWYKQNLDSIIGVKTSNNKTLHSISETELYMRTMGFKADKMYVRTQKNHVNFHAKVPNLKSISSFDYLLPIEENSYRDNDVKIKFMLDSMRCELNFNFESDSCIQISCADEIKLLNLSEFIENKFKIYGVSSHDDIPLAQMQLIKKFSAFEFVFEFHAVEVNISNSTHKVKSFSGELYIRRNSELMH